MTARAALTNATLCHEWSTQRGSAKIEERGANVILVTATGHWDSTLGKNIATTVEMHLRVRPRHLFFDLGELDDYQSEVRVRMTRVLLEQRSRMLSLHVFARSKIVRMGVSVASLALQDLVAHADRREFSAALNTALAEVSPEVR